MKITSYLFVKLNHQIRSFIEGNIFCLFVYITIIMIEYIFCDIIRDILKDAMFIWTISKILVIIIINQSS